MHTCVLGDPPEEQQHGLGESLKVVVPVDLCGVIQGDFPKHLAEKRKNWVSCGKRGS
jgi:hypothetical protein